MSGCIRYPALDLTPALTYKSSTVDWIQVLPAGGTILVEASVNGDDFGAVSKGGSIPGLSASDSLASVYVTFKVTLTKGTNGTSPTLSGLTPQVIGEGAQLTGATAYYNFGGLKWTSGLNKGRAMEVKRWDASTRTVVLFLPMPNLLAVGDTFEAYPGCAKDIATCRDTFDNILNFRGEPYVPGQDALTAIADVKQNTSVQS